MKPTLLVLAAGIGSRYGGLKQIDPVGPSGEIIIDYSIYDAIRSGFNKVVFVICKDIEQAFRETVGRRFENKIQVEYAFQELDMLPNGRRPVKERRKPWGTGHAIIVAEPFIKGPFAVINADDFYGRSGYELLANYLSSTKDGDIAEYCMVAFILRKTLSEFGVVSRGVCYCDDRGYLENVVERTKIEKDGNTARYLDENGNVHPLTGDEIVSMNMWGFTASIFKHLHHHFMQFLESKADDVKAEFFIPTVVNRMIKEKSARVKMLESTDSWFGITYRQDKPYVVENIKKLIKQGCYPEKLDFNVGFDKTEKV